MANPSDTPGPDSDLADLHALQAGETVALDRIVARWEKPLFAFAWRYLRNATDARDLAAETFVRLYQNRAKLAADSKVSAWLFKTLSNLCRNQYRWQKRHPSASFDEAIDHDRASEELAPAAELEQRERLQALAAAIERLPHDLKVTLLLHHYEHLGYREIATATGCSERGVETRLYRARARLRAELATVLADAASR